VAGQGEKLMKNHGKQYLEERRERILNPNFLEEDIGESQPISGFTKVLFFLIILGFGVGAIYALVNGFIVK